MSTENALTFNRGDTTDWHSLLSRGDTVEAPHQALQRVAGRTVLITGGGGYIGAALAHQMVRADARHVILLDHAEAGLYATTSSLARDTDVHITGVLGNAGDYALLNEIFRQHQPDLVFHAAAYKHVPLAEQNPCVVVENNVRAVAELSSVCVQHPATELVMVSTDKAVEPCSLMGASKRLGELLLLAHPPASTRRIVRLGNVLGSPGSVGPLLAQQIAHGASVTVTDPRATRYFLTVAEATTYLLAALASPHEACLLVPLLRPPVNIADLARAMMGTRSNPLVYTGVRHGDKAEERLLSSTETVIATYPGGLRGVVSPHPSAEALARLIGELLEAARQRDLLRLLAIVREAVPDYMPSQRLLQDAAREESS